ncbi:hypothetical protein [Glycomyces xiaoerkulensis]|uniref:hypothetical protein n=1 Tax=Glycomyces xiaoerkulensis TaxID=2038139 RepID=UPI0012FFD5CA|nr:hypothetical protein [Glycomyces xiaoerkulensis]
MPAPHASIARSLAPLAVLALSTSACAAIEPLETTGLYELFESPAPESECGRDDSSSLYEDDADLRGPHFAVSFSCHFAATEVPEQVAAEAEELAGLPQLIDGAELLINRIAPAPYFEPEDQTATSGAEDHWVEAGGERIDLDHMPVPGNYIAVSVPSGEDAVLWVEDEGRTQGLDFRTGDRVDPVAAYYNGVSLKKRKDDGWKYEDVKLWKGGRYWEIGCWSDWSYVTRALWDRERGWAPAGSAWLTVDFWWCGGDHTFDEVTWELDTERAIKVWDGDRYLDPVDWSETENRGEERGLDVTVVFEVPVETDVLIADFTPVSEIIEHETGDRYRLRNLPEATEWMYLF